MPLYMDFHQIDGVTVEEVKKAHISDISVQDKYGVRFLQFWVNEESGNVYCLMEGPDPDACENCHQESHGALACNIQEVEPGFFNLFMGKGLPTDNHLTLTINGDIDLANRSILVIDLRRINLLSKIDDDEKQLPLADEREIVTRTIEQANGRFVEYSSDESLVGVFSSSIDTIRCAKTLRNRLLEYTLRVQGEVNLEFKIAINLGQPLTEKGGFFENTLKKAKRLCLVTPTNGITVSHNLLEIYHKELYKEAKGFKCNVFSESEESFIDRLFGLIEDNMGSESFNVTRLAGLIGLSRPQLYRKTMALTGLSPNSFITQLKLKHAWWLLRNSKDNITEVAFLVGFSNPSYFSKKFLEYFGYSPSSLLE